MITQTELVAAPNNSTLELGQPGMRRVYIKHCGLWRNRAGAAVDTGYLTFETAKPGADAHLVRPDPNQPMRVSPA